MRVVLLCALALSVSACASSGKREPEIRTVEVLVPVREACVPPDVPTPGEYADVALTDATPPDERYRLIAQGNLERKARLARIEPIVAACR
jgi:hypothetical protein